jgi:hypothetical protein
MGTPDHVADALERRSDSRSSSQTEIMGEAPGQTDVASVGLARASVITLACTLAMVNNVSCEVKYSV